MNSKDAMFHTTDDVRIASLKPLISPAILMEELPVSLYASQTINEARDAIGQIVLDTDAKRMVVIAGPCSIHDPEAALEYAAHLKRAAERFREELLIVMRVYFEKPRTTVGWKGLINDPNLDGSFYINKGLRTARKLLLDINNMNLPAGTEFLDNIIPQFLCDLISWGAIGARTTESQIHRELASGLSMPVGFKNGTEGSIKIAVDAIGAAQNPHHFLSVTKQGIPAIVNTAGNPHCHVILRGSNSGPNFDVSHIKQTKEQLNAAGLKQRIVIDCSHGNSQKDPARQPLVIEDICQQIKGGEDHICGVMLESHLKGGNQDLKPGQPLEYGKSITDACLSWDETLPLLEQLAEAMASRK